MVNRQKINQKTSEWPVWRLVLTVLNLLAIFLSIILSWHYFKEGAMPGCGAGSSCDQVLSSRWATLLGIVPVSGLALGAYLAVFLAIFNIGSSIEVAIRRMSWIIMLILGGTIIGSAIWFTILQKWIIQNFCVYCMSAHITGFLLSVLIIWRAVKEIDITNNSKRLLKTTRIFSFILVGLILSGMTAAIQFKYTPSSTAQKSYQDSIHTEIDIQNAPIIGSTDAPYKVTLLFDYQCSHCQKIHFMLKSVERQYDGKLAFILSPTPLENSCNPYVPPKKTTFENSCKLAKIGLAVWKANPQAFSEFENWMFTFDSGNTWHPRTIEAVEAKAAELLGHKKLAAAMADPWVDQYLQTNIQLFGQTLKNGRGVIPKMIYNNSWVVPEPYNADDLIRILQESLGVPKP